MTGELEVVAARLLGEAWLLRLALAAGGVVVTAVPITYVPAARSVERPPARRLREALRHLRDEMLLVQSGRAGTLCVLEDEMARVERLERLAR